MNLNDLTALAALLRRSALLANLIGVAVFDLGFGLGLGFGFGVARGIGAEFWNEILERGGDMFSLLLLL